ncbi:MAG: TIGR03668 family PPOX class F420-dependent oxidoreductase [Candidatus Binatia bacterium]
MKPLTRAELAFLRAARIAHLASADAAGQPHVIPICFVFDGKHFFSPIDEKPKRVLPQKLKRVSNVRENPRVSLIIDRYDEDWNRLAYVLVRGKATILMRGVRHKQAVQQLRKKYRQYRRMAIDNNPVIQITPDRWIQWGAI